MDLTEIQISNILSLANINHSDFYWMERCKAFMLMLFLESPQDTPLSAITDRNLIILVPIKFNK